MSLCSIIIDTKVGGLIHATVPHITVIPVGFFIVLDHLSLLMTMLHFLFWKGKYEKVPTQAQTQELPEIYQGQTIYIRLDDLAIPVCQSPIHSQSQEFQTLARIHEDPDPLLCED